MITNNEAIAITLEARRKAIANVDFVIVKIEEAIIKAAEKGEFEVKGSISIDNRQIDLGLFFVESYLHAKGFGAIVERQNENLVEFKVSWGK